MAVAFNKSSRLHMGEAMARGTTLVDQPLDLLLNKEFEGNYRDLCDQWKLNAIITEEDRSSYTTI